tara:strand:+ start:188 stop:706 length:519 start_codon:yes stop_codon:yes gene_type:complete
LILNYLTLLFLLIGLTLHREISSYWEENDSPEFTDAGYNLYAGLFAFILLFHSIWLFGLQIGLVFFLFSFFQIIFGGILWVLLLPTLIKDSNHNLEPNWYAYGIWLCVIIILGLLAIVNFIYGEYSSFLNEVLTLVNGYKNLLRWSLLILIGGNILRVISMKLISNYFSGIR